MFRLHLKGGVALLLFCVPLCAAPQSQGPSASLSSHDWIIPLRATVERGAESRQKVWSLLEENAGEKNSQRLLSPAIANLEDWAAKRAQVSAQLNWNDQANASEIWRAAREDFFVARSLLQSPIAADRRIVLSVANRWMQSPLAQKQMPTLAPLIAEGFILPFVAAASSKNSEEISRGQLLQNVSAIFLNAGRQGDYAATLRSLIALSGSAPFESRELGDWARFQLAQFLIKNNDQAGATVLLNQIQTPGLRK